MLASYLVTSSIVGPKETAGTLLYAIDRANSSSDVPDEIIFSAGLQIVVPGDNDLPEGLPALIGPTKITGNNAEIRGVGTNRPWYGLRINDGTTGGVGPFTISNLRINAFAFAGIYVEHLDVNSTISITGNQIYSNGGSGVSIANGAGATSGANSITGNFIGTSGGNTGHGILLGQNASNFDVSGNQIANNGGTNPTLDGIALTGSATGNRISNNTFVITNGGIPIDLDHGGIYAGATMNDTMDDSDTGPNGMLNYPENISFSLSGSTWTVSGTLDFPTSTTGQHAFVELYKYTAATNEYRRIATSPSITLGANGNATWSINVPNGSGANEIVSGGEVVALAIHDESDNTSEMSPRSIVGQPAVDLFIGGTENFRGISGQLHLEYKISGPPNGHAFPFHIGIYRVNVLTGAETFMFRHFVSDEPFLRVQGSQHGRSIPVPAEFDTNDSQEEYYLRAKLDDLNANAEPNEQNNLAIYGGGVYRSPAALHAMGSWRAEGDQTFTATESGGTMTVVDSTLVNFGYSGVALPLFVRSGNGNDIIDVSGVMTAITIWSGIGNDTLDMDGAATMPTVASKFDPGAGANTLTINKDKVYLDTFWNSVNDPVAALTTTVQGGAELNTNRLWQNGLLIQENSRVKLLPDGGFDNPPSILNSVEIEAGSTLDITNQALIIDYTGASPLVTIRGYILSGRGGSGMSPTWTGTGITSSTAAASPINTRSVGYGENSALLYPYNSTTRLFRGVAVDGTCVLICYTVTGDATLNGIVNSDDVTVMSAYWGGPPREWYQGDFDFDGAVENDDSTLVGANYNPSAAPA